MKILIKSDVYNICNRIKKFDVSYRVVYDTATNAYQIYSTNLQGEIELIGWTPLSYVCRLPYNELDIRCIKYLYDTSVDNLEQIIEQIDATNAKIEHENQLKIQQQSSLIAENKLRQLTK
ncbi:MAG: hypothetical protein IJ358_00500 [Clostridia bacterium]|nr:hypothetical protein [Clostridia bacterium]